MRTATDYKKLVDGYKLSLSLLKVINSEVFEKFMLAKDLMEQHCWFSQLVCQLKIDFIQEHDEVDCGEIKIVNSNNEYFGLTYMPKDDYSLTLIYEKVELLGTKRHIFQVIPQSQLDNSSDNSCVLVFATLNKNDQVTKSHEYHAYLVEDMIVVFKRSALKNGLIKNEPCLSIPMDMTKQNNFEKMF